MVEALFAFFRVNTPRLSSSKQPCRPGNKRHHTYLQHLSLNSRHSILDPFTDFWMSTLPHRVVIFARFEKGGSRIYISFVEDGVNGHGEEVPEGGDDSIVAVQRGGFLIVGHAYLAFARLGYLGFAC